MNYFLKNKTDVVQCVSDELDRLKSGSALTTIITAEPSGGYSVHTVTDGSSEDIERLMGRIYYGLLTNTL